MDGFTNILLITLISLIGYIGNLFYTEQKQFRDEIRRIVEADISSKKDTEQLRKDVDDHEKRISNLEDKI